MRQCRCCQELCVVGVGVCVGGGGGGGWGAGWGGGGEGGGGGVFGPSVVEEEQQSLPHVLLYERGNGGLLGPVGEGIFRGGGGWVWGEGFKGGVEGLGEGLRERERGEERCGGKGGGAEI